MKNSVQILLLICCAFCSVGRPVLVEVSNLVAPMSNEASVTSVPDSVSDEALQQNGIEEPPKEEVVEEEDLKQVNRISGSSTTNNSSKDINVVLDVVTDELKDHGDAPSDDRMLSGVAKGWLVFGAFVLCAVSVIFGAACWFVSAARKSSPNRGSEGIVLAQYVAPEYVASPDNTDCEEQEHYISGDRGSTQLSNIIEESEGSSTDIVGARHNMQRSDKCSDDLELTMQRLQHKSGVNRQPGTILHYAEVHDPPAENFPLVPPNEISDTEVQQQIPVAGIENRPLYEHYSVLEEFVKKHNMQPIIEDSDVEHMIQRNELLHAEIKRNEETLVAIADKKRLLSCSSNLDENEELSTSGNEAENKLLSASGNEGENGQLSASGNGSENGSANEQLSTSGNGSENEQLSSGNGSENEQLLGSGNGSENKQGSGSKAEN